MKLKQLILSSIALGALAFTVGMAQPAHAAIGMETPAPAQNLEKPASVTTQHHINVDGKVLEPVKDHQNVAYVDGQPLVALRQVSEALGYKVAWDAPTKTALVVHEHRYTSHPTRSCANRTKRQIANHQP